MKRIGKLLVIPDAHAHPDYDNGRFDALGKFIADEAPDVIVSLGDWADMPSLGHYDKGKRKAEGRRYTRDVEVTQDSLARLRSSGRAAYVRAKKFIVLGNHEARIDRATNEDPELHGAISTRDLGFEDAGWDVTPYQEVLSLAGWSFSHHFAAGVGGRPASTTNAMLKATHCSAIAGHKHTLEHGLTTRPDRTRIHSIIGGCFTHHRAKEDWNRGSEHLSWNGVLVLHDVADGDCGEMRMVTQARLRRAYG
ncbi:MAG TPA: metallophosphoesterase [Polyangiaceae bacterium]|nr:metallophosphoesterase [Polyangiaceae bacterium]